MIMYSRNEKGIKETEMHVTKADIAAYVSQKYGCHIKAKDISSGGIRRRKRK